MLASSFTHTVQDGPLVLAAGVAVLVGVLGFLSPCVLPLVPGYLSYVAGLTGPVDSTDSGSGPAGGGVAVATRPRLERRMLVGAALFVVGFSVIFIAEGAFFGSL